MVTEGNAEKKLGATKYTFEILNRFDKRVERIVALHGNEIHVLLESKRDIPDLCDYVSNELKAKLATMICNDERETCGAFTLRYVFEKGGEDDLFIILTARIGETKGAKNTETESHLSFPSIALRIPSAALYERESRACSGYGPTVILTPDLSFFTSIGPQAFIH